MKRKELNACEAKYGYKPTRIAVAIDATAENAANGKYALVRFLYVYADKKPDQPLLPLASKPRDAGLFSVTYLQ